MVEIKEDFRTRFERALAYADKKPADVARSTGISEATLSQYRSGYSKPKRDRLVMIADLLGVNPAWLMGLDVPMVDDRAADGETLALARKMVADPEIVELYKMKQQSAERFAAYLAAFKALYGKE